MLFVKFQIPILHLLQQGAGPAKKKRKVCKYNAKLNAHVVQAGVHLFKTGDQHAEGMAMFCSTFHKQLPRAEDDGIRFFFLIIPVIFSVILQLFFICIFIWIINLFFWWGFVLCYCFSEKPPLDWNGNLFTLADAKDHPLRLRLSKCIKHALTAYRQHGQALTLQVIEEGINKDCRDYADEKGGKDLFEQRCARE